MPEAKQKHSIGKKAWYQAKRVSTALGDTRSLPIEHGSSESHSDGSSEGLAIKVADESSMSGELLTVPGEAERHMPHISATTNALDSAFVPNPANTNSSSAVGLVNSAEESGNESSIAKELQAWAVSHQIKRTAVTSLLKILKNHHCFSALPSDARALLRTPRLHGASVVDMGPGQYCHFGLQRGLHQALQTVEHVPSVLSLLFNIDGLPVSKSSRTQIWPVLCLVTNCKGLAPFPVGVFAGSSKPPEPNEFLTKFVDELLCLLENGIAAHNSQYSVEVHSFVCDAPARSFVMRTKLHTGWMLQLPMVSCRRRVH